MRLLPASPLALLVLAWTSSAHAAAPTASSASATLSEDLGTVIALRASDPERDALTYEIVTRPSHGTVTISGRNAQYAPTANYNGPDTFTFRARDTGGSTSNTATISCTVTPANDPPTAAAATLSVQENHSGSFTLRASDVDRDPLTFSITSTPANGTVTLNPTTGAGVFTPTTGWSGTTTLPFQVSDGLVTANGSVAVTVVGTNSVPVANASAVTLNEDAGAAFRLSASDADNDALTFAIAAAPTHGTATLSGSTVTYTPNANYSGTDRLQFMASDASSSSARATVTLTIAPVNDVPTTSSTSASTNEDTPVRFSLPGNDIDGDTLTWVIDNASNGTAVVDAASGLVTFTPAANVSGGGQVVFHVNDGLMSSLAASASVTIAPVDDAPVASAFTATVPEGSSETALVLVGIDPDSPSLTYTITTMPAHGTVLLLGHSAKYTPNGGYSGTDSFAYTASDGGHTSAPATVDITITPDIAHVLPRDTSVMTDGSPVVIAPKAAYDTPVTGTLAIVSEPAHGSVEISSGAFVYTPDDGYIGRDHFYWQVTADGRSAEAEVIVNSVPPWGGASSQLSQIGINNLHFFADQTGNDPSSASMMYQPSYILDDLTDLGLESIRQTSLADVMWASFEPQDNLYFDGDPEALLETTELEPRATLFSLQYASPTPPWATSPTQFQKRMGEDAYAYLDAVLTRYADSIRYWELGNEMYHWTAATPPVDTTSQAGLPDSYPLDGYSPEEQADFLSAAAAYIRSRDPDAIIVLPSVIAGDTGTDDWLRRVVHHSGSAWFDVVTYHSYPTWTMARADRPALESVMNEIGLQDKLVQLTETGSSSDPSYTENTDYPNSQTTQAADIFRRVIPAWAAGDSTVMWHTYREHTDDVEAGIEGNALFEDDGSPKPSAFTMMLMNTELLPFVQVTDFSDPSPGAYAYEILSADGTTHWVVWGSGTWTVPAGMSEVTSVMPERDGGFSWRPAPPASVLSLDDTPVLLR